MYNQFFLVQNNDRFGIIDFDGEICVPTDYLIIKKLSKNLYQCFGTEKIDYFDVSKAQIISLIE
jgi:hypothetical protein